MLTNHCDAFDRKNINQHLDISKRPDSHILRPPRSGSSITEAEKPSDKMEKKATRWKNQEIDAPGEPP